MALRYVDTDAGVATGAGVATVTLLTVGTHVARATLTLVPILRRVYACHFLFQQNSTSVLGDETLGPAGPFLKIQVFWNITLCHWIRIFRRFEGY